MLKICSTSKTRSFHSWSAMWCVVCCVRAGSVQGTGGCSAERMHDAKSETKRTAFSTIMLDLKPLAVQLVRCLHVFSSRLKFGRSDWHSAQEPAPGAQAVPSLHHSSLATDEVIVTTSAALLILLLLLDWCRCRTSMHYLRREAREAHAARQRENDDIQRVATAEGLAEVAQTMTQNQLEIERLKGQLRLSEAEGRLQISQLALAYAQQSLAANKSGEFSLPSSLQQQRGSTSHTHPPGPAGDGTLMQMQPCRRSEQVESQTGSEAEADDPACSVYSPSSSWAAESPGSSVVQGYASAMSSGLREQVSSRLHHAGTEASRSRAKLTRELFVQPST